MEVDAPRRPFSAGAVRFLAASGDLAASPPRLASPLLTGTAAPWRSCSAPAGWAAPSGFLWQDAGTESRAGCALSSESLTSITSASAATATSSARAAAFTPAAFVPAAFALPAFAPRAAFAPARGAAEGATALGLVLFAALPSPGAATAGTSVGFPPLGVLSAARFLRARAGAPGGAVARLGAAGGAGASLLLGAAFCAPFGAPVAAAPSAAWSLASHARSTSWQSFSADRGSHVQSSRGQPTHLTWYSTRPPRPLRWATTFSTS